MTDKTFEKYKAVVDQWFTNGFNGAEAYRTLYPKARRADDSFSKIQRIPEVAQYIKAKQDEAKKALRTTHAVLLEELENWAYSDITETLLLTPEQLKELPEEIRRLITRFESTTRNYDDAGYSETVVKLWFVSKEKAMEMIHKHTGFYGKDNSQKSNVIIETREERDAYLKKIQEKIKQDANA